MDRLGLDTSNTITFLTSLGKAFAGEWAVYRQALRDISQQDGFPFYVNFPTLPQEKDIV